MMTSLEQWRETIDPKYEKKVKAALAPFRNEHLKIVCQGVGLETHPRYSWDLLINVAVLTYRMFQHGDITSYPKTPGITNSTQ